MAALTEEFVLTKTRAKELSSIRNLNFWGSDIDDVSIMQHMPNLEVVSASVNKISELGWFSHCSRLQELYLRKNEVNSVQELHHLRDLPNLSVLWLNENPLNADCEYREYAIAMLQRLTKLDGVDVTVEERREAEDNFARKHPDLLRSPPRENGRPPNNSCKKPPLTPRGSSYAWQEPVPAAPTGLREPSPRGIREPSQRGISPRHVPSTSHVGLGLGQGSVLPIQLDPTPRPARDPSPTPLKAMQRMPSPRDKARERQPDSGRAKMSPRSRSNAYSAAVLMIQDMNLDDLMFMKTEIDSCMRRAVIQNARGVQP